MKMSQEMLNKGICESTYHSVMNMVVDTGTLRHTVLNMSPGEKKKKKSIAKCLVGIIQVTCLGPVSTFLSTGLCIYILLL